MSSLWEVPAYLIMAFSLALDAPVEKASRDPAQPVPQVSNPVSFEAPRGFEMPEAVWLRAVKTAAPLSDVLRYYANRIFITSSGKPYAPVGSDRLEIMSLQNNGEVVARVIAAATRTNKIILSGLGNKPTPGVLLVAHMHGIASAQRLCAVLDHDPEALAGEVLPELAGDLQLMPLITVAALEARLTAVATGRQAAPKSHDNASRNNIRHKERFAFGASFLKGSVTQGESRIDGRVARVR